MLVLSRTKNQTIMIGDDIEITIVDIRGDNIRIGINAPTKIPVHRKEVYLAIKEENVRAAKAEAAALDGAVDLLGALGNKNASDKRDKNEKDNKEKKDK